MRNALLAALCCALFFGCTDDPDGSSPTGGVGGTGATGEPSAMGGTGGSGGTAASAGSGGAGGSGDTSPGGSCADADTTGTDLHGAAAAVLTAETPCGFSSCHQGAGKAMLVLKDVSDLNAALVGMTSCEAGNMPLVDASGGDSALANSYLWQKLVGTIDASGAITGDASWGEGGACGQTPDQPYGVLMPLGTTEPISEERLAPIRNWICAGAPGP